MANFIGDVIDSKYEYRPSMSDLALDAAQREHRPHSLIGTQRFWQPVAHAPGVVAWGYAYDGGKFFRD